MPLYADLELNLRGLSEHDYAISLRLRRAYDGLRIDPLPAGPPLIFTYGPDEAAQLQALAADPAAYGLALGHALLGGPLLGVLDQACAAAASRGAYLRLSLEIDHAAAELDAIRWELIRHPLSGQPLASDGLIRFTRFLSSLSWRTLPLRPRGQIRAVAAVAAPSDATGWGLAPIDAQAELAIAQAGLDGLQLSLLGGAYGYTTRSSLLATLQTNVDLLYLVAHGGLKPADPQPQPVLYLQSPGGSAEMITSEELLSDLNTLTTLPRLVILVACRSADPAAAGSFARLLVRLGVPAVVAMQGDLSIETAHRFLPALLAALQRDEPIDAAVAAGRAAAIAAQCDDWWMPALFSRISDGQIWQASDLGARQRLASWLRIASPQLNTQQLHALADALLACPSASQLSLAQLPDLGALCVELEFWDAGDPALDSLYATLADLYLLPVVLWAEVAALQRLLASIQLAESDLRYLYGRCRPSAAGWEPPVGRNVADTLFQMTRLLASSQPDRAAGSQPLLAFVRLLLEDFARPVASIADALGAWEVRLATRLGLPPRAQPAQPAAPQHPALVIQLSLAPGVINPNIDQPDQIAVFLDAWLLSYAASASPMPLANRERHSLATARTSFAQLEQRARELANGSGGLLVEFVLPLELLPLDVDRWPVLRGMRRPQPVAVGIAQSVVVRSLDRLQAAPRDAVMPTWMKRWQQRLAVQSATLDSALVLIDSPVGYRFHAIQAALLRDEKVLLLQTAEPSTKLDDLLDLLDAVVGAGMPAALLVRQGCIDPQQTSSSLRAELSKRLLDALPALVYDQRFAAAQQDDGHYGARLTLLWDDPERLPPIMDYTADQL